MPAPTGDTSKRIAARNTTELYRSCMNLSEEARSLLVKNEGMKRLGLNAQVLAAHTGEQGGALEVIVAEIGRLSSSIRESLVNLGEASKVLSDLSIGILHLSHLHTSYADGWASGIDPSGRELYGAILAKVGATQSGHLDDLDRRLRAVSSLVDDLGRIAQQIPPVTTMIQIVITEVRIRSVELLGTVEDLKAFHVHLDAKIERMREIWNVCSRYIQELQREER